MRQNITLFKIALMAILFCYMQTTTAQKKEKEIPNWIEMMNNPDINYFEAVTSFDNYWKNREKPIEENEIFVAKNSKVREIKSPEALQYSFEYKKFIFWKRKTLPFVKKDGTIMTKEEQIELWENEKKSRNQ